MASCLRASTTAALRLRHGPTSKTALCVRCLSSRPAGSPVMVGVPEEFTRGPEDKRLVNHTGEESIVSCCCC